MLVLASVLMSFIIGAVAEPVLPKYVVPLNNRTNVRSETSRTGDNIILEVGIDDVLQVIGYSYDMEGNLWWRVLDYSSNKDGYILAQGLKELGDEEGQKRKEETDSNTDRMPANVEQESDLSVPEFVNAEFPYCAVISEMPNVLICAKSQSALNTYIGSSICLDKEPEGSYAYTLEVDELPDIQLLYSTKKEEEMVIQWLSSALVSQMMGSFDMSGSQDDQSQIIGNESTGETTDYKAEILMRLERILGKEASVTDALNLNVQIAEELDRRAYDTPKFSVPIGEWKVGKNLEPGTYMLMAVEDGNFYKNSSIEIISHRWKGNYFSPYLEDGSIPFENLVLLDGDTIHIKYDEVLFKKCATVVRLSEECGTMYDLSSMSESELLVLNEEIVKLLGNSDEVSRFSLNGGIYVVGKDIPEGMYDVEMCGSARGGNYTFEVYSSAKDMGVWNGVPAVYGFADESQTVRNITLHAGEVVYLDDAAAVFSKGTEDVFFGPGKNTVQTVSLPVYNTQLQEVKTTPEVAQSEELSLSATPMPLPTNAPITALENHAAHSQAAVSNKNFSIRNGIQFGMDITDVQAIEQHENRVSVSYYGITYAEASAFVASKQNNTSYIFDENTYIFTDMVAGQECNVVYVFDDENKLISLRYLSEYNMLSSNLSDSLVAKYGAPQYSASKMPFETKSFFYYDLCSATYYNDCEQHSYSGWLIPFDNTYVAIEAICFSLSDMMCYECITYTPISFSEYNKATNEIQTSISNDL